MSEITIPAPVAIASRHNIGGTGEFVAVEWNAVVSINGESVRLYSEPQMIYMRDKLADAERNAAFLRGELSACARMAEQILKIYRSEDGE